MNFTFKCNNWHMNVSGWKKKNPRDRQAHCCCNKFSLSAKTWEKGRRKVNVKGWRRDRPSHCNCKNWSLSANTWEKNRRKMILSAWRKNLRCRHSHCRCNNFSLSAMTWERSRMNFICKCNNWHLNVSAWRKKHLRDRQSHWRWNNFSLSVTTWRRKSSSSKVSFQRLTPSSPRWSNSAMNARNVMLKMPLQTAPGSSWQLVYLLTQQAVASWGRLSSRHLKFLLGKWNWSLPTLPMARTFVPPLNGSEHPIKFPRMCWNTAGAMRIGLKYFDWTTKFQLRSIHLKSSKSNCNWKIEKVHCNSNKNRPLILGVQAALGGFVRGQDLRKGFKILAADGSIVEVAHPPEVSEKRGKVVLETDKAKFLGLRAIFFPNTISE